MDKPFTPTCFRCGKTGESDEIFSLALDHGYDSGEEFLLHEEGTYNPETNTYACDSCYIAIGTPSSRTGWKAPAMLDGVS